MMRGLHMGQILHNIRSGHHSGIKDELHSMGIVVGNVIDFERNFAALMVFKKSCERP